jgi:hypothetical protein
MSNGNPDPFEMMKRFWAPFGVPVPGMVAPTLNAEDIDKRISDLKSVETWLNMNLGMLRMHIQGLEMQKAAVASMKAGMGGGAQAPAGDPAQGQPGSSGNPFADAWWNVLAAAQKAGDGSGGTGQK